METKIWTVSVDDFAGALPFENESGTVHQLNYEQNGTHEFVVKAETAEEAVKMVQAFTADWTYKAKLADEVYVAEFERMSKNQRYSKALGVQQAFAEVGE
jgi:hypothetical protein